MADISLSHLYSSTRFSFLCSKRVSSIQTNACTSNFALKYYISYYKKIIANSHARRELFPQQFPTLIGLASSLGSRLQGKSFRHWLDIRPYLFPALTSGPSLRAIPLQISILITSPEQQSFMERTFHILD